MSTTTTIFLVEYHGRRHAFRNQTDAWNHARESILEAFDTSGLTIADTGIDLTRLAGPGSLPADWFELSVQWNEFWDTEDDMQVLIYDEIPLD
jgi:hypothetical protein